MNKVDEGIKTWVAIGGVIVALFAFTLESCMGRREINANFNQVRRDLGRIESKIDRLESQARDDRNRIADKALHHRNRIESKVEQLNQNYIKHLSDHNKKD